MLCIHSAHSGNAKETVNFLFVLLRTRFRISGRAVGHPERLRVLLGAHDLSRPQKQSAAHAVSRVLVHPGYSHPYFDAALLRLAQEEGKDAARPLCLPSSGDHYPPGSKTLVAGWGRVHTCEPLGFVRASGL